MNNENEIKEELNEVINEDIKDDQVIETEEKLDSISEEKTQETVSKTEKWNDRPVNRKFVAAALAATLLLNAALSAGMIALFSKKFDHRAYAHDRNRSIPNEQFFDNDSRGGRDGINDFGGRGGKMMPPEGPQDNANAPQQDQQQEQQMKASIGVIIREDSGVVVSKISGENAKKAGFKEGDKITSLDGTKISSSSELINALASHKAGDTVTVGIERSGQAMEIKTVLE